MALAIFLAPRKEARLEAGLIAYRIRLYGSRRQARKPAPRHFGVRLRGLLSFRAVVLRGRQRWRFRFTRNSTIETPSLSRSFLWSKACGPRIRIFPRSPITRCQGMPFPDGEAAMARPAGRAPPGKRRSLATPPYVRTFPRGIR